MCVPTKQYGKRETTKGNSKRREKVQALFLREQRNKHHEEASPEAKNGRIHKLAREREGLRRLNYRTTM